MSLLIFDWGDTVMIDHEEEGTMYTWNRVDPVPGIMIALSELSKKYTCCIATNADFSSREALIKALKRIDADKYFKNFFSSKEMDYEKPDKRFFLYIAGVMKVKPDNCIVIGNNYNKDIKGAKDAGMRSIFFNAKEIPGEYTAADKVITMMEQLIESVEQIT